MFGAGGRGGGRPSLVAETRPHPGEESRVIEPTEPTGLAGYPLLSAERDLVREGWPDPLAAMLGRIGVLGKDERITGVARAGEGNMNLTLRVTTSTGSLIVKQSRPWVARYPHIPAPAQRTGVEYCFYQRVAGIAGVAERMPLILGFDEAAHVLVLEDLGRLSDLSAVYRGVDLPESALADLASFLAKLHRGTRGRADPALANRAMRRLNHEHIFVVPIDPDNGLDLDRHEAGLKDAARELIGDRAVVARIRDLGERYLCDGPCLLHGDYFPGSWLETEAGVRIIDPEFCYFGDPEFDIGVALAHLRMADPSGDLAVRWLAASLDAYDEVCGWALDDRLVTQYAAVEIIRRLIGVAQLPILRTAGRRAGLLAAARKTLRDPAKEALSP